MPFLLQLFNSVFLLFIRDIVIKINFSIVFSLTLKKKNKNENKNKKQIIDLFIL